jgi:hypothetical protein
MNKMRFLLLVVLFPTAAQQQSRHNPRKTLFCRDRSPRGLRFASLYFANPRKEIIYAFAA